ncbi:MAG TPA: DUF3341 domain-containing protein [Chitinophagales bacterium]|nr:DUF3341 domain-containing protein [Chitinophagales bacterium]
MKTYLLGLYDDDEVLLNAVDKVRAQNIKIHDVVTPFAVHGLDEKLGLRESKLHIGGFYIGMTGLAIAFSFMTWVFTANWPIVFGGKPHFSFPAFIPIMFEFTVLSASIGMTVTFLALCHLYPGRFRESLDPRTTSHLFGMVFKITDKTTQEEKDRISQVLRESGAVEVKERAMEKHY